MNVLLIAPSYMDYANEISLALKDMGHDVFYISDRPDATIVAQIITRITNKLNDFFYYQKFLNFVESYDGHFDTIIVINGEGLSCKSVSVILERHPESYRVFYTWDSFKNKAQNYSIFNLFDKKFTFDFEDARNSTWDYKPLFFSDRHFNDTGKNNVGQDTFDLSFIGSFQQHRFNFLRKLYKNREIKGTYILVSQNIFLYYIQMLFNLVYLSDFKNIVQLNKLNLSEVKRIYGESRCILDLPSPSQSGLTIRVFETLASGKKLVTTSSNIVYEQLYDTKHVHIVDLVEILLDSKELLSFINSDDSSSEVDLTKYSLSFWLEDFLVNKRTG